MDENHMIKQVQERAHLESRERAEKTVHAVLETLAERIPGGLADNLAAQLPPEVGDDLRRVAADPEHDMGERFDRGEFVRRVDERSGALEGSAEERSRVVFEVIEEATTGVMDKVRDALPEDLRELAEASSS